MLNKHTEILGVKLFYKNKAIFLFIFLYGKIKKLFNAKFIFPYNWLNKNE